MAQAAEKTLGTAFQPARPAAITKVIPIGVTLELDVGGSQIILRSAADGCDRLGTAGVSRTSGAEHAALASAVYDLFKTAGLIP